MSCSTVVELDTDIPTDRGTLGKGRMIFTGPQGTRDHRMTLLDGTHTGEGFETPEKTSDLNYLLRASEDHIPSRKSQSVPFGSIGWGIPKKQDFSVMDSGHQIKIGKAGPFRQRNEDRYTHRLQEPYYPTHAPDSDRSTSRQSSRPSKNSARPVSGASHQSRPQSSKNSSRAPSTLNLSAGDSGPTY
eukprot:scpid79989/ scgid14683/ Uncharacterized protein C4orf45 homolog